MDRDAERQGGGRGDGRGDVRYDSEGLDLMTDTVSELSIDLTHPVTERHVGRPSTPPPLLVTEHSSSHTPFTRYNRLSTGLTTGYIVQTNTQPVVKPVVKRV